MHFQEHEPAGIRAGRSTLWQGRAPIAFRGPDGQRPAMTLHSDPVSESAPGDRGTTPAIPDIRVGTVSSAERTQDKTHLWIDFGAHLGVRRATMTLAKRYKPAQLVGRQVCAVVNPHLHTASINQVLALGMPDHSGDTVLICPDRRVPDGGKLF